MTIYNLTRETVLMMINEHKNGSPYSKIGVKYGCSASYARGLCLGNRGPLRNEKDISLVIKPSQCEQILNGWHNEKEKNFDHDLSKKWSLMWFKLNDAIGV